MPWTTPPMYSEAPRVSRSLTPNPFRFMGNLILSFVKVDNEGSLLSTPVASSVMLSISKSICLLKDLVNLPGTCLHQ